MRAVVVRRLLSVGETGGVTRVHVRIAAEAVGVSERTMWRWLAQGRGGQITPTPRSSGGFFLDDAAWERLGLLGGNVSALYRWMTHERGSGPAEEKAVVPSPATFLRVVRRDLRAGRVLQVARPAPGHADPGGYDCALAELALPRLDSDGALDLTDVAPVPVTEPLVGAAGGGVRLYAPGARLVSTRQLAAVAEAVAHTVAARGSICVFGETGCGKTLAVEQALHLLSRRIPLWRAVMAVRPGLPQLRATLLAALGVPAEPLSHRAEATDRALLQALQQPGVLFLDDTQRLAPPELDYLRLLMDAPTTQATTVLCGAGSERTLARAPALASRILTWHQVPRLKAAQLPDVLPLFHPLWATADPTDLHHADQTCARGNFRTWAKLTSHVYAAVNRRSAALWTAPC